MSRYRVLISVLILAGLFLSACQPIVVPTDQFIDPEALAHMQTGLSLFISSASGMSDEQLEAAVTQFGHALALQPDWAEVYVCRAYAMGLSGYYHDWDLTSMPDTLNEALAEIDSALALRPDLADAYLARVALVW